MATSKALKPLQKRIRWAQSYRIINVRFPPIDVFERIADPVDWEHLIELEMMTNPRVRDQVGEISLVPTEDRVSGPGASWIMAPFTHTGWPSRFTDGSFGVYYAARQLITAVAEKAYHMGRFYAATQEPIGTTMELRALVAKIDARFHDIRGGYPQLHDADEYAPGQIFAAGLRGMGSNGVVYDSVRHAGGACLGAFVPNAIGLPISGPNLRFHWNGQHVDRYFNFATKRWGDVPRDS